MPEISKKNTRNSRKMFGGSFIEESMKLTNEEVIGFIKNDRIQPKTNDKLVETTQKHFINLSTYKNLMNNEDTTISTWMNDNFIKNRSSLNLLGKERAEINSISEKRIEYKGQRGDLNNIPLNLSEDPPTVTYSPNEFKHSSIVGQGWTDPDDIASTTVDVFGQPPVDSNWTKQDLPQLRSYEGPIIIDDDTGRPINPMLRTGITNRGVLGQWGCNYAADPILLWIQDGYLTSLMIERSDVTNDSGVHPFAIPGGMVDAGQDVSITLLKELLEECGGFNPKDLEPFKNLRSFVEGVRNNQQINKNPDFFEAAVQLFGDPTIKNSRPKGIQAYKGYVDDSRNTDNAWMETSAVGYFISDNNKELYEALTKNRRSSSEGKTTVVTLKPENFEPTQFFASHFFMIQKALEELLKPENHELSTEPERKIISRYLAPTSSYPAPPASHRDYAAQMVTEAQAAARINPMNTTMGQKRDMNDPDIEARFNKRKSKSKNRKGGKKSKKVRKSKKVKKSIKRRKHTKRRRAGKSSRTR